MTRRNSWQQVSLLLMTAVILLIALAIPTKALADEAEPTDEPLEVAAAEEEAEPLDANSGGNVNVYRLYNRVTSEHLYTTNKKEYDTLPYKTRGNWVQEGIAWVAPKKSSTPVYRLYNPRSGDHHYTTSKGERDKLVRNYGWKSEGVAFYSDDSKRVPLYRVYNGRLKRGQHHYTTSKGERDSLVRKSGWRNEGTGFYAVKKGKGSSFNAARFVNVPLTIDGIVLDPPWAGGADWGTFLYIRTDGTWHIEGEAGSPVMNGSHSISGYWLPDPEDRNSITLVNSRGSASWTFTIHVDEDGWDDDAVLYGGSYSETFFRLDYGD